MKVLLVVDLQKQFNADLRYNDCIDYIKNNRDDYDVMIPLVYSHRVNGDINDEHESDLESDKCMYCNELDLEYDTNGSAVIVRNTYSSDYMLDDIPDDGEVDVIGCDDMSGIMANCFVLWDNNINFRILSEYVYTNDKDIPNEVLNKYMKQHFGRCVA